MKKQKDRSTRGDRYTRAKSAWLRGRTTRQTGREERGRECVREKEDTVESQCGKKREEEERSSAERAMEEAGHGEKQGDEG